ncbi:adenylate/guanylate cyclase domain-containing protein [Thermodesulfobacteriota bacterium]
MEKYKRKLAAIFSADVAGYSRLMGDDEAATVDTITSYREVMYSLIKQHRGRVVDSPGDNILAEFASVVDAAQCAVAVQKELQSRNQELPENRRMQFRIGLNLGDVIEEDERIYGDGVNIAARLEALADPGGICISKTAFDHIETKLPLGYEFIGEQTVKNISKPVFAYRVIMDPMVVSQSKTRRSSIKSAWISKSVIAGGVAVLILLIFSFTGIIPRCSDPQTGKSNDQRPSIVILPFKNMSDESSQQHFSDGITEELIHSLARVEGLRVVSRTSSFYYKGKNVSLSTLSRELSVDHVLEGSVRKDGNKLRITVQLISVPDDTHLLSLTYDREMKDIFDIQDEIAKAVVAKLKIELLGTEIEEEEKYSIVEHERRMGLNVEIKDDEIITGGLLATGLSIDMAGSVKGGLKAFGANVKISGISRDVVDFLAMNATLSGNFKDNVKGTAEKIIISGTFDKDLEVDAERITLTSTAVIKGDFYYSGKLDREEGSQIFGKITQMEGEDMDALSYPEISVEKSKTLNLLGKIYWDVSLIILGIFIYFLFPKQNEKILSTISAAPYFKSLIKGILIFIVSPFIILISMVSFVGIPFGIIYSCLLTVIIILGPLYGSLWAGNKLLKIFKLSFSDNFFISLITGIIFIDILSMIPYAGWIVKAVISLLSISAIWHVTWTALKAAREEAVGTEY